MALRIRYACGHEDQLMTVPPGSEVVTEDPSPCMDCAAAQSIKTIGQGLLDQIERSKSLDEASNLEEDTRDPLPQSMSPQRWVHENIDLDRYDGEDIHLLYVFLAELIESGMMLENVGISDVSYDEDCMSCFAPGWNMLTDDGLYQCLECRACNTTL